MRLARSLLALVFVFATACAGSDVTDPPRTGSAPTAPSTEPTTTAVTTEPDGTEPATTPPPSAILRPDGLGPFDFGEDAGEVQTWLVEQLGQPSASVDEPGALGWPMPSCAERGFAYWADAALTVGFTDLTGDGGGPDGACDRGPELAGWYVVDEGSPWFAPDHGEPPVVSFERTLTTPDGIGLGATAGALLASDPDVAFGDWDVDGFAPASFVTSDGMPGRVAWDPTADVQRAIDELGVTLPAFQSANGIDEDGVGPRTLAVLGVTVPEDSPIVFLSAGTWDWSF